MIVSVEEGGIKGRMLVLRAPVPSGAPFAEPCGTTKKFSYCECHTLGVPARWRAHLVPLRLSCNRV